MLPSLLAQSRSRAINLPDWFFIVGFIAFAFAIGGLIWYVDHARRKALYALLRSLGFEVRDKSAAFVPADHTEILGNPLLIYARNKAAWSAIGQFNGKFIRLIEYRYTTGGGKSQTTHVHLIATTDLPLDIPEFTIERKRWLMGHRPQYKGVPLPSANPALAGAFTCYSPAPSVAGAIITPQLGAILQSWDKTRWLRLGDGVLAIGIRKRASVQELPRLLEDLDRCFEALLTPLMSEALRANPADVPAIRTSTTPVNDPEQVLRTR
jgi:hypothetical protein